MCMCNTGTVWVEGMVCFQHIPASSRALSTLLTMSSMSLFQIHSRLISMAESKK